MSVEAIKSKVVQVCRQEGVGRLELFGSRARSGGVSGRDYDFLAVFDDLPAEEYSKRYFRTLHGLEDVLGAPVDLLTPGSVKRDSLKRKIEEEKVLVYES